MTESTVDSILAEIHAEVADKPAPEAKQDEVKAAPEENQDEVVTEDVAAEDETAQDDVVSEDEDEQPKKKSRRSAREWAEHEKQLRHESEARWKAESELKEKRIAELEALLKGKITEEKPKEAEDDFEPLDPEAARKYEQKLEELEKKLEQKLSKVEEKTEAEKFVSALDLVESHGKKEDAAFDDRVQAMIRAEAEELYWGGQAKDAESAYQKGMQSYINKLQSVYKAHGNNPQAIYQYIMSRSEGLVQAKAKPAAKKPSVDIKEIENLRKSAGAPTNKVAAGSGGSGELDALMSQIHNEHRQLNGY